MPRHSGGAVGLAAEAEGSIAFQILGEEFSRGLKLLADHSEAVQPGAHGEARVLGLDRLAGRALHFLRSGADRKAELDEGPQETGVQAILFAVCRRQKVISAEFYRPLGEGRVEIRKIM